MSSERSTLVRRWPSTPDLVAFCLSGQKGDGGEVSWIGAYGIASCKFLFGADDVAISLSSVQSCLAADDGLSLRRTTGDLAADFGDGIPVVRHVCYNV